MTPLHGFVALLLLSALLPACANVAKDPDARSAAGNLPALHPPAQQTVYSPSALEALSRGIAAITPPGAALQDIYYEFDSVDLKAESEAILKKNAEWMKAHPSSRVEVEGHCDDVGSAEYNLALGAKRAQIARDYLVKEGISPDRLVTISYGKEAPACFEPSEECRVKNRRARFVMFTELPTS